MESACEFVLRPNNPVNTDARASAVIAKLGAREPLAVDVEAV
jgi:hypothetical protein